MSMQAPISHHLVLYDYWLAKRGSSRSMPARRDLDPSDIPKPLPCVMIVDKIDDRLRWRLVGTAAVREIGRDPTGSIVGSYITGPGSAAAVRATFERVFTTVDPLFATGEIKVKSGANHNFSLLVLPLSDDGADVNMVVSTLITRFDFGVSPSTDWLMGAPVKVRDAIGIDSAADLERRCLDWERHCDDQRRHAEPI